jgi:hypothetical protein
MIANNCSILIFLVTAVVAGSGCTKKSVSMASKDRYEEELGKSRPHYTYVEPVIEKSKEPEKKDPPPRYRPTKSEEPLYVNKRLEAVLDTMAEQNRAIRYISGFRIQLYVGNTRQEADNAKSYVYQLFPELNPYVSYSQPSYRVKVGDFMYRADAEAYLDQMRQQYSSAVILPERVEIKRGLEIRASAETLK